MKLVHLSMLNAIFYYQKKHSKRFAIHVRQDGSSSAQPGIHVPKGDLDSTPKGGCLGMGFLGNRSEAQRKRQCFSSWVVSTHLKNISQIGNLP